MGVVLPFAPFKEKGGGAEGADVGERAADGASELSLEPAEEDATSFLTSVFAKSDVLS